jgi:cytochrome oxidase Cu insertion factor (SCO1/SenC/PrrC family)
MLIFFFLSVFYSANISAQIKPKLEYEKLFEQLMKDADNLNKTSIGKQYTDFIVTDLDNNTIPEQQLLGKVTLLNFWFKECAPCIAEFKYLNNLYHKYIDNSNFQLISFTSDSAEDTEDTKNTSAKYDIQYTVVPVSLGECQRLNLDNNFSTNIIIDKTWKIIYLKTGGKVWVDGVKKEISILEEKIKECLLAL